MHDSLLPILMAGLLIKHFVADFPLQTLWMASHKGTFLHPGGLAHAAIHMVATLVVFIIMAGYITTSGTTLFALILAEGIIHYAIDYTKMNLDRKLNYSHLLYKNGTITGRLITSNNYYLLLGVDQLLHGLTYVAILYVIA